MSEEEKELIEYWKEKLKDYKKEINERQNDEFKGYGTSEDIAKLKYCNLHILLNLIENQQREKELHIKLEQQYKKEYLDAKEENKKKDARIKDLEHKLNAKEILSNDMPEDTEFIIMTRDNYERNHGKM